MKSITSILLSVMLISGLSSTASAYGDWVSAKKVGSEKIDYTFARCYYKTSSYGSFADQRISIIIKGSTYSCPYSIEYNPVTSEWK